MSGMQMTTNGISLIAVCKSVGFTADLEIAGTGLSYGWLKIKLDDGKLELLINREEAVVLAAALDHFLVDVTEGQDHLPNKKEGNIVPVIDSIASSGNG